MSAPFREYDPRAPALPTRMVHAAAGLTAGAQRAYHHGGSRGFAMRRVVPALVIVRPAFLCHGVPWRRGRA